MDRLFVTGGAGFIGSAFIRLLMAEAPHCHLTNFDALTYAGNPDNLTGIEATITGLSTAILQTSVPC